jgi:hypothetical protein
MRWFDLSRRTQAELGDIGQLHRFLLMADRNWPGYNRVMTLWQEHLGSDPAICGGTLCARGTRVPVTVILDNLAEGSSRDVFFEAIRLSGTNTSMPHLPMPLSWRTKSS